MFELKFTEKLITLIVIPYQFISQHLKFDHAFNSNSYKNFIKLLIIFKILLNKDSL